jgi:hypothetical protein
MRNSRSSLSLRREVARLRRCSRSSWTLRNLAGEDGHQHEQQPFSSSPLAPIPGSLDRDVARTLLERKASQGSELGRECQATTDNSQECAPPPPLHVHQRNPQHQQPQRSYQRRRSLSNSLDTLYSLHSNIAIDSATSDPAACISLSSPSRYISRQQPGSYQFSERNSLSLSEQTWGSIYNRLFTSSSICSSSAAGCMEFSVEYNSLARKHGLVEIDHRMINVSRPESTVISTPPKPPPSSWLLKKILRKSPAHTLHKQPRDHHYHRHFHHHHQHEQDIRRSDLSELAKLGGCSVFTLPHDIAIGPLVIPSCFSSTATFLYTQGNSSG